MADTRKRRSGRTPLIWLAQGAITLALIGWLVNRVDYSTIATVKSVSIPTFFIAVLVYSLSQFCCAARLRMLISIGETLPELPRLFYVVKLTLSTYFISNFLPGTIGGDAVKVFALTRRAVPLARAVSTLLLDRLTNMAAAVGLSVVTIAIAAPDLLARLRINPLFPLALIFLLGGAIAGLALLARLSNSVAYIGKALREIALSWLRSPPILIAALVLSIASILTAIGAQWIFASGLNVPANPLQLTAVICLVYLVTLAPITLNGIGLQEVTTVVLLEQLGTQKSIAVSFALLTRLMILALSVLGAAVTATDRKLYTDLRQGPVRSAQSRFLGMLQQSPVTKRLVEFLPFAREPRPRR
ncbi:MAG: flippase-like domain-containing protein [Hyphomicrobiales bacterium]|nr:flippase-like domain-containing protein [Hyphomicrobiales bacterium]